MHVRKGREGRSSVRSWTYIVIVIWAFLDAARPSLIDPKQATGVHDRKRDLDLRVGRLSQPEHGVSMYHLSAHTVSADDDRVYVWEFGRIAESLDEGVEHLKGTDTVRVARVDAISTAARRGSGRDENVSFVAFTRLAPALESLIGETSPYVLGPIVAFPHHQIARASLARLIGKRPPIGVDPKVGRDEEHLSLLYEPIRLLDRLRTSDPRMIKVVPAITSLAFKTINGTCGECCMLNVR